MCFDIDGAAIRRKLLSVVLTWLSSPFMGTVLGTLVGAMTSTVIGKKERFHASGRSLGLTRPIGAGPDRIFPPTRREERR
jgi:phosphate/sulfate permease